MNKAVSVTLFAFAFLAGCAAVNEDGQLPFASKSENGVTTAGGFARDGVLSFVVFQNGVSIDQCSGKVNRSGPSILSCAEFGDVVMPPNPDAWGQYNGTFIGDIEVWGFTVSGWGKYGNEAYVSTLYTEQTSGQ